MEVIHMPKDLPTTQRQVESDFSRISPTAKLVAYFRQFTDIPCAQAIARLIDAEAVTETICPDSAMLDDLKKFVTPAIEARYKSMISAIKRTGNQQVLELASGLSFRGILMTTDPNVIYVETDLPVLTREKMSVVEQIPVLQQAYQRPNFFVDAVDALSIRDLNHALRHFDPKKPIAIIHEGLYMYLSRSEKETLANNIKEILRRFGGVWITPDFMVEAEVEHLMNQPRVRSIMDSMTTSIAALTGRDLKQDQFKDQSELSNFFEKCGYKFTINPQIDGSYELSSLKTFPMTENHLSVLKEALRLWILRLR
jgi:O-methyltransferase involved in polyketide biosynthesis